MDGVVPGTSPISEVIDAVNGHPLNRLSSFNVAGARDGGAHGTITVTEASSNLGSVLHGGVLYLALDTVAAFAAVSAIEPGHNAVTHDINVSVLASVPIGTVVNVEARVLRAGRRLVFVHAEAVVDGRPVAIARITKSVVRNG